MLETLSSSLCIDLIWIIYGKKGKKVYFEQKHVYVWEVIYYQEKKNNIQKKM